MNSLGKISTNIFPIYRGRVLEDQQGKITDVSIVGRSEIPSITKSLKTLRRTMNNKEEKNVNLQIFTKQNACKSLKSISKQYI